MKTKYVGPLMLPIELHQRLEQLANAQERDTLQQARWLLRQALTADQAPQQRDLAAVGAGEPERAA